MPLALQDDPTAPRPGKRGMKKTSFNSSSSRVDVQQAFHEVRLRRQHSQGWSTSLGQLQALQAAKSKPKSKSSVKLMAMWPT